MNRSYGRWFCFWLVSLWGLSSCLYAQTEAGDSIHISRSFMKALEGAFEFGPMPDTIRYKDELLTRQQLREWVGDVDTTLYQAELLQRRQLEAAEGDTLGDSLYLDPRFLGLAPPTLSTSIMFPDFSKEINMWKSKNGRYSIIRTNTYGTGTAISGFDFKKGLSELLIPKYRKLRKSRKIADDNKTRMDAAFPMWKTP